MTVVHEREPVAEILRAMAADRDVCGELVDAARTHSPEVARLTEAETHSHAAALIRAAGTWFATFGRVEEQDFAAALLLGADRAGQGIPMTAVLRGVQAALTRAVEITLDRCRSAGVPDSTLLTVVLRLKEYGDAVERHVINGYRAAERGRTPDGVSENRTRLLRQLLVGGVVPSSEELARAGLRPDGPYHCLVSDIGDSARSRLLSRRLSALRGISGLVEGRLVGLCPRVPRSEEIEASTLVVTSPAAPLDGLRPMYRLCVRAVGIGERQERRGLYDVTDFAAEIALADQPLLGSLLGERLLAGLDRSDGFHRQLALTAQAFLDNGRRLDQTAAALFTHPNTVRYRLGRLQQLTGVSLTDPQPPTDPQPENRSGPLSTLHWWWALTTWLRADADADA
ncbi:PucR family transcriptional regulator [Streptomyces spongiae]|uniref:PucR family transcriptional regulator n=1 Tax=Streptomyces spongiae TaxID=565072 RepID=A0A5N8XSK6_9ACTN|nr:helix-turn-helix domain-containing protein [Streptomyces spongiae]MPY61595.1 PucR family transcriptional regulator [Streptomyces spongiae]